MAENGRAAVIRAIGKGPELRADDEGSPTLFGHFAVFDRWTEINSFFEGHFMERIAPGAFRKTIRENRDRIRALFQHGADPEVGDKPIGRIEELREDSDGAYYEVSLYDGIPELVMSGLRDGQYGASFRFQVMREDVVEEPDASDDNPRALPERTIKELRLHEFGPVTFPAYADATAGVRSLTDHFTFEQVERHPDLVRSLLTLDLSPSDSEDEDAPASTDAGTSTSGQARRASRDYLAREEESTWHL
jgi:HK97 family phage prohead protease